MLLFCCRLCDMCVLRMFNNFGITFFFLSSYLHVSDYHSCSKLRANLGCFSAMLKIIIGCGVLIKVWALAFLETSCCCLLSAFGSRSMGAFKSCFCFLLSLNY